MTSSTRPLEGLRVLDASRVLAGPYLAMLLGDLGADVVKVERPGGDQTRGWGPPWVGDEDEKTSSYFVSANRNKRSVVLDLKSPPGRRAFYRLLETSDVLVENFLPADWKKLGLDPSGFREEYPDLIWCTVTGYGADDDRPAYDVVLQAESGLMGVTGFPEGEPVRVGVAVVDFLSALYGLAGVLAAVAKRQAGGSGRRVEISMIDAATSFLSYAAQGFLTDGAAPARLGSKHPNLVPYQAVRAADGWLVVGAGSDSLWRRFCRALERPDWIDDPRFAGNEARLEHREELDRRVESIVSEQPTEHWLGRLREHRVPCSHVAGVGEALEWARRRGQVVRLPRGAYGELSTVAAPFLLDGARPDPRMPPPGLGEHTDAVLREIGVDETDIRQILDELK